MMEGGGASGGRVGGVSLSTASMERLLGDLREVERQRDDCAVRFASDAASAAEKAALRECVASLDDRVAILSGALEAVSAALGDDDDEDDADDEEVEEERPLPGFVRASAVDDLATAPSAPDEDDDGLRGTGGEEVAAMYAAICGATRRKDDEACEDEDGGAYGTNFWCSICAVRVRTQSRTVHETSLTHTLSRKIKPRMRRVMLPDGNAGAQILAKLGCILGERLGLGASGREGRIQPLSIALKRDTAGLGHRDYEKRVTHFKAGEATAIAAVRSRNAPKVPPPQPKTTVAQRRMEAAKAQARARQAETRRRREFDTNIPEGYESLFR